MRWTVLALVFAPSLARAEPAPTRGSIGMGVGVASGGMVDSGAECGDPRRRTTVEVHGAAGAGEVQLAAGLGLAVFGLPTSACNFDFSSADATGRELRATVGVRKVSATASPIRFHLRATAGVAWLHLDTHEQSWSPDPDVPDTDRNGASDGWGPVAELGVGATYVRGRGWVGLELAGAYAWLTRHDSLGYETEPGGEIGAQLVFGRDL